MPKYVYPAVFTPEDGKYSLEFRDLEGCYSCGDDLWDALEMAKDVLALTLYSYEVDGKEIPLPSNPKDISLKAGEFVNQITCDTLVYRKRFNSKAVKKTLTIPAWLNDAAIAMEINFSQALQEILLQKTGL